MKLLLAFFLCFPAVAFGQWRPVSVTSDTTKAIQENFRRASLWSNRKLDRFSNDTLYGKYTFTGHVNGNGGMTVSTFTVTGSAFSVGGSTFVCTAGKCGIGTASPGTPLQVTESGISINVDPQAAAFGEVPAGTNIYSSTHTTILGDSNGAAGSKLVLGYRYISGSAFNSALEIANPASGYGNLLLMKSGGNIGIGDTVPQAKLTVNGNIHSSGTISATTFIGPAVLVATQTFTGINTFISSASFSGAMSTVTFHGWVDIGRELIVGADSGSATATASCTGGKNLIGGGCGGNATMASSYPQDADTWYCNAPGATALSAYLICARVK